MNSTIQNILVGIDFSEGSAQALRFAAQLAMQSGAQLHVLNVYGNTVPLAADTYAFGFNAEEYLQRLQQDISRRHVALADLVENEVISRGSGQVMVSQHLREGEARTAILGAIEDFKADLLIVGSHGRSAVKRMLLGSVSTFLCHHCPIPVLVVPFQDRSTQCCAD